MAYNPRLAPERLIHDAHDVGSSDIFQSARFCQDCFEAYLRCSRLYGKKVDELKRQFMTWTGFLGVFAPVSVCLDTRLSNKPELKELVMSMLAVLSRNLERGIKRHIIIQGDSNSQPPPENDGAMVGMLGAIDRLSRLAFIIRAPSKPDDVERVLKFARKRDPDGFNEVILALVRWSFPLDKMSESFHLQLASSVIYRRDRLMYHAKHEMKLQADRNDETVSASAPSKVFSQEDKQPAAKPMPYRPRADSPEAKFSTSENRPGDLYRRALLPRNIEEASKGGAPKTDDASSIRSMNPFTSASYPKPPTKEPGAAFSQCTYCCRPLQGQGPITEKKWRKHVEEDLKPYVCISEQCGNLPPAFASRGSWENHMESTHGSDWVQNLHRPDQWLCTIKHHSAYSFNSEEALLDHLEKVHSNELEDSQRALVASRSKRPLPLDAHICPFCGKEITLSPSVTTAVKAPHAEQLRETYELGSSTPDSELLQPKTSQSSRDTTPPSSPSLNPSRKSQAKLDESRKDVLTKKMWKHVADHLEALAFWSLRWWDDNPDEAGGESLAYDIGTSASGRSLGQPLDLATRIQEACVLSQFPQPDQEFLPAKMIDTLVNSEAMLEKIPNLLDSEDGRELAAYFLENAKNIFAIIAIECGFDSEDLERILKEFKKLEMGDENLPISMPIDGGHETNPMPFSQIPSLWTRNKVAAFCQSQWKYLAPVFLDGIFKYEFGPDHIMPFTMIRPDQWGSSAALQAFIHPAHRNDEAQLTDDTPTSLALLEFVPWTNRNTDRYDRHWAIQEAHLETIKQLNHRHVVNPLALVCINSTKYVIFQWEELGSLYDYWRNNTPNLSSQLVIDMIRQLRGIVDASAMIQSLGVTGIYPKPESILRCPNGTDLGRLVLSNLGMPEHGSEDTTKTTKEDLTQTKNVDYTPPEIDDFINLRSTSSDISWSMGCIMLDFLIWLLYGGEELERFHLSLVNGSDYSGFYDASTKAISKPTEVKETVLAWMTHLAADEECAGPTALRDLLQMVKEKLLIIPISGNDKQDKAHRMTISELRDALDILLQNRNLSGGYFFTGRSREGLLGYHAKAARMSSDHEGFSIVHRLVMTCQSHPTISLQDYAALQNFDTQYEAGGKQKPVLKNLLNEALSAAKLTVNSDRQSHSTIAPILRDLGNWLAQRFEKTGGLLFLDQAIDAHATSIQIDPRDEVDLCVSLTDLEKCLIIRYEHTMSMEDLEKAIEVAKRAVIATPDKRPDLTRRLKRLVTLVRERFERIGTTYSLNKNVDIVTEACRRLPQETSEYVFCLHILADFSSKRWKNSHRMEDLKSAMDVVNRIIHVAPQDDLELDDFFVNLDDIQLDLTGPDAVQDLNSVINMAEMAMSNTSQNHANLSVIKHGLANLLSVRFNMAGGLDDEEAQLLLFEQSLNHEGGALIIRILSASRAADTYINRNDWKHSSRLLEQAVLLLPEVGIGLWQDEIAQSLLPRISGLASKATATALSAGEELGKTLQLLEVGRGILAGSFIDTRTDVSALDEQHPGLAHKFTRLKKNLVHTKTGPFKWMPSDDVSSVQSRVGQRQRLSREFDDLVETIRTHPGFHGFLQPPSIEELVSAASHGPLVIINTSSFRCDAILVQPSGIRLLPLPDLQLDDIRENLSAIYQVDNGRFSSLSQWIWDVICHPCLDALGFTSAVTDDNWPRIWWIPTGLLTKFPLHMAGCYDEQSSPSDNVIDRVMSSYALSIKALLYGRRKHAHRPTQDIRRASSLLVAMDKKPGGMTLGYVKKEGELLNRVCLSLQMDLNRPPPQKRNIISELQSCQVFHFAGSADWKGLHLEDDSLTARDILDCQLKDDPPFLAYLSSCWTGASKDLGLADEGIHLAGAFQLAGFRHSIGMLWEAPDKLCFEVAKMLYETIQSEGLTDDAICQGLHRALKGFRDEGMKWSSEMSDNDEASDGDDGDDGDDGSEIVTRVGWVVLSEREQKMRECHWLPFAHFGI